VISWVGGSVANPHRLGADPCQNRAFQFYTDPNPVFHFNAVPDPAFMRIRTFQSDADPDLDPHQSYAKMQPLT
jgi:hypothetical protein